MFIDSKLSCVCTRKLLAAAFIFLTQDSEERSAIIYHFFLFVAFLEVVDHYENPRNVGSLDKNNKNVGTGLVGAPACGDVMKLQVSLEVTSRDSLRLS